MGELGLGTIVIVLVVIWYLGRAINAILDGSGEVAEKEFDLFKQKQDLRIHKERQKLYKTVQKGIEAPVYNKEDWDKLFNPEKED